ncbi:thymidylate synthase [Stenotrophomonas phage Philippe]|uniref:ThyX-like thymidylate synthase n=1 Tax=Stenotrophomonas phage Philippe TaxID=2859655 RepID=A0AAE7WML2_9CAUD|nr:thymidylate synthase [Stenotrophomonas phage Philippe]QYW02253.1 ThyX-like thymidylate synthase [Stenotrophomonas phage Philippe]
MKSVETPIILAHSVSPQGIELITWQLRYWRPIHSELMTHRVFSRNAGSSRARPSKAIIDQVRNDPWGPLHWGANEPGMQANAELTDTAGAQAIWRMAAQTAAGRAHQLMDNYGAHKQIVNRLLEPFTYIDVVLSGTDFANWYALRDHKDAQPEIRELASLMKEVQAHSAPQLLEPGEWHLPYITEEDWTTAASVVPESRYQERDVLELLRKASAARCARVSYKLHDGSKTDFTKDLELFERLLVSQPLHASPAEHQATPDSFEPMTQTWDNLREHGNFRGWRQFRKQLPNEYVPG